MPSTVPIPSLRRERTLWAEDRLLIGVDEVGRGPLAGPVVAAAVVFAPDTPRVRGLRDSKVLRAKQRERLAGRIRERALHIGLGAASTREIDRFNIRVATAIAMRRALVRLLGGAGELQTGLVSQRPTALPPYRLTALPPVFHIIIDGLPFPEVGFEHDALVDGDAHCYSIAAAGGRGQVRARSVDGVAARPVSGLWLGDEQGVRHRGASRGDRPGGTYQASSDELWAGGAVGTLGKYEC